MPPEESSATETSAPDSAARTPGTEEADCPPRGPECEPGVDDLACTAAGDKAKATYNDTFAEDLQTAKADYETTRTAYRTARQDNRLLVEDLRHQIRHLVDRIRCQIEQRRVWKCLDDAFGEVLSELTDCPDADPCCVDECDFPTDGIEGMSLKELTATITDYQQRIDEAKTCFAELKGEPEALQGRVDDVKSRVDKINNMLGGDAATLDLKSAYAEALVAQWLIGQVWGGFDQVQDFVNCLCQALTCWTKGCAAVYQLTGAQAVAQCKDQADKDRCVKLRTKTVEQILAGYDRRCAKEDCPDHDDDGDGDGGNGDGNGGGHDHHDHHHCGHEDHGCGHEHHDCGCGHRRDRKEPPKHRD